MKIRINKCSDPGAWYAKHVGEVLPVERVEINRRPDQGIATPEKSERTQFYP